MPDEEQTQEDRASRGFLEDAESISFARRPRTISVPTRNVTGVNRPGLLELSGAMSPASWRSPEEIEEMEAMSPEEQERREEAKAKLNELDTEERRQRSENRLKGWREWDVFRDGALSGVERSVPIAALEGFATGGVKSVALAGGTVASSISSMAASLLQNSLKIVTLGRGAAFHDGVDSALGWIHDLSDLARDAYINDLRDANYGGGGAFQPYMEAGAVVGEALGNTGVWAAETAFRLWAIKSMTGHLYGASKAQMTERSQAAVRTFESVRNLPGMGKLAGVAAENARLAKSLGAASKWADSVLQGGLSKQAMTRLGGAAKMAITSSAMRRYDSMGNEFLVDYLANSAWAFGFMATTVASGLIPGEGAASVLRIGADFGLNTVLSMARGEFGDSYQQGYQEALASGMTPEQAELRGYMQLGMVHLVNAVFASGTKSYASEQMKATYVHGKLASLQDSASRVENLNRETGEAMRTGVLFEIDRRIHSSERADRPENDATLMRLRDERNTWANAPYEDVLAHSMVWMRDHLGVDLSKETDRYVADLERNVINAAEKNRQVREEKQKTAATQRATVNLRGDDSPTPARVIRALDIAAGDHVRDAIGDSLNVHVKGIRDELQRELRVRAEAEKDDTVRKTLRRRAGAVGNMGNRKLLALSQELFGEGFNQRVGAQSRAIVSGVVKAVDEAKRIADSKQIVPEDQVAGLKAYASYVREAMPDIAKVMAEQTAVEREAVERVEAVTAEVRAAADQRKAERDAQERAVPAPRPAEPAADVRAQRSLSEGGPLDRAGAVAQIADLAKRTGGRWTPLKASDSPELGTLRIGKASIRYTYEPLPEGRAAAVERRPGFDYTVRIDPETGRLSSVAHEAGHIVRDVLTDREKTLLKQATGLDLDTREGDEGFARRFESPEGLRGLADEVRALPVAQQGVMVRAVNKVIDFVNALFGSDIKHVGDAREIERLAENIEDFRVLRQLAEGERGLDARDAMGEREMLAGRQARAASGGAAGRAAGPDGQCRGG